MEKLFDLIEELKARCIKNELMIMAQAHLSPAEYNGILALDPGEKVCGSTISSRMNLSPSRASRVIEKLVKNGYLVREGDFLDRRRCTISLADKGVQVRKRIDEVKSNCEKRVIERLSDRELRYFTASLKKVNEVF